MGPWENVGFAQFHSFDQLGRDNKTLRRYVCPPPGMQLMSFIQFWKSLRANCWVKSETELSDLFPKLNYQDRQLDFTGLRICWKPSTGCGLSTKYKTEDRLCPQSKLTKYIYGTGAVWVQEIVGKKNRHWKTLFTIWSEEVRQIEGDSTRLLS